MAGDPDGLGYFGYAYYAANKDKLRAVAVKKDDDAEPVTPSPETILDKTYAPLSRPLYIYVKNSAMRRPEVAAFLKYYLETSTTSAEKGGYVAPTAEDQAANQDGPRPARSAATAEPQMRVRRVEVAVRPPTLIALRPSITTTAPPSRAARPAPTSGPGHRASCAFREAAVDASSCSLCAVITVLTTVGIIVVLGVETVAVLPRRRGSAWPSSSSGPSSSPTATRRVRHPAAGLGDVRDRRRARR